MIDNQTIEQLRSLRLDGMLAALNVNIRCPPPLPRSSNRFIDVDRSVAAIV